jgi:hypothetical protein
MLQRKQHQSSSKQSARDVSRRAQRRVGRCGRRPAPSLPICVETRDRPRAPVGCLRRCRARRLRRSSQTLLTRTGATASEPPHRTVPCRMRDQNEPRRHNDAPRGCLGAPETRVRASAARNFAPLPTLSERPRVLRRAGRGLLDDRSAHRRLGYLGVRSAPGKDSYSKRVPRAQSANSFC